ncbi:MAG: transglutaminase domain-containing protein [Clostridia bacterium]|nr:transglutaminase domain-containing protein [Clostridia bacterium]
MKDRKLSRFEPASIPGSLCRLTVAYIGALGLGLVISDAFGLGIPALTAVFCAVSCLAVYLILIAFEIFIPASFAVAAGEVVLAYYALKRYGMLDFRELFVRGPAGLWNACVGRLVSIGYTGLSGLSLPEDGDPAVGMAVLCLLVSVIFVCCTFSVPRLLPVIVIAAAPLTVVFMYNLPNDNTGFLLVVAAGLGILTLKYYRSFTSRSKSGNGGEKNKKTKQPFRRTANGGFAALTVAAAIILTGMYPALKIREPAPEATIFTDFLDKMREITYRFVSGDSSGSSQGPGTVYGDISERRAMPERKDYKNTVVLSVKADTPVPVYLRSWIGGYCENGVWQAPGVPETRVKFPDSVTDLFYEVLGDVAGGWGFDRSAVHGARASYDERGAKLGFINERVGVTSRAFSTRLSVPVAPSLVDGSLSGVVARATLKSGAVRGNITPGSEYNMQSCVPYYAAAGFRTYIDADLFGNCVDYFDEYVAWAFSTMYGPPELDVRIVLGSDPLPYLRIRDELEKAGINVTPRGELPPVPDDVLDSVLSEFRDQIPQMPDYEYMPVTKDEILKKLITMSRADLDLIRSRIDDIRQYNQHAEGYYTSLNGVTPEERRVLSDTIRKLGLPERFGMPETPGDAINLASKVAKGLASITEYDVSPSGYDASSSALVQFLSTVRRGYCVQYATAAALMLRMMGVPARYCEGFIAKDFKSADGGYVSEVKDSDAHSWVEIYVRNYGWMTFEMTKSINGASASREISRDDPSRPGTDTPPPDDTTGRDETRPPVQDTTDGGGRVTEPPVTTDDVSGERSGGFTRAALFALIFIAASFALVAVSAALEGKRKRFISSLSAAASRAGKNGAREQAEYTEYIFRLLGYIGLTQGVSEQLSDFAERARTTGGIPAGFPDVTLIMQRLTFGGESDERGCAAVASYAIALRAHVSGTIGGWRRFWLRDVLKRI